jgi:hypothetical protein
MHHKAGDGARASNVAFHFEDFFYASVWKSSGVYNLWKCNEHMFPVGIHRNGMKLQSDRKVF